MREYPLEEEVKKIFRDVYNFYVKWSSADEVDWDKLMKEVHELEAKYPFDLCRKMLVETTSTIERYYMKERSKDHE